MADNMKVGPWGTVRRHFIANPRWDKPLVEITVDTSGLDRMKLAFAELGAEGFAKGQARAINHVGNKAFTRVRSKVAKQMGLKVGEAGTAMGKELATARNPVYRIIGRGSHFPIYKFGGKQAKRGASAAPWGKRRVFAGTFVATMRSGHVGIFKRLPGTQMRLSRYKWPSREKIEELAGPAVPVEMIRGETKAAFEQLVDTELMKRMEHELAREVLRVKAKYGL